MSRISRQKRQEISNFKDQFKKKLEETRKSSTNKDPVKATCSLGTQPTGNSARGSISKKEVTVSSCVLETARNYEGRLARTQERTSTFTRSCSLQREQNLTPSASRYNSTRKSEYDSRNSVTPQRLDSLEPSSTIGLKSSGYENYDAMVSASSVSTCGISGSGAGSTLSYPIPLVRNASKTDTMGSEFQSNTALPGSSDSSTFTFEPLSTSIRSNERSSRASDRSVASRLRSASQGLRNLGNTCYMNSILQCLAKIPWFKEGSMHHQRFCDDLLREFFVLMKKMQDNDSDLSLDPFQFRKQISALGFQFSSSEQNDAHEFLLCLLSRLSKNLKSEQTQDIVREFLSGTQQSVIRFTECNHVLVKDQPFFSISLPVCLESGNSRSRNKTVDLLECLETYTKEENVDGSALCLSCEQMQQCSIETSFKHLPKFLIIHLKRFNFLGTEKLENEVSFPLKNLMIKQFDLDPYGKDTGKAKDICYDLIAVCNHYGSLRFGHYTADIKSSNNWYNYSDSRVTQNRLFGTSSRLASREACILFYERMND